MDLQKNQGFFLRLRYASAGLIHCLRCERSLRTHTLAVAAVLVCLLILRPPPLWWALASICSAAVIAAELLNSALERLADHLHPDLHPQIRIVKDSGAAAVLVLACGAIGVAVALAIEMWRR